MIINAEHGLGTGLGDCLTMCWLPDTLFYVENPIKKELFDLFGRKWFDDKDHLRQAKPMIKAFQYDLSNLKSTPRLESWMNGLTLTGKPCRPTAHIPRKAEAWAGLTTQRTPKPIILFPFSKVKSRQWPLNYWVDLAWRLKEKGENPVIFVPEKNDKLNRAPNYCHGYSLTYIAAFMMKAKLVVANDSLPAHMGGTLNVKTLVLAGPTNKNVFHHCPSVEVIHGNMNCSPCCFRNPFRAPCDLGCFALYSLGVEEVFNWICRSS